MSVTIEEVLSNAGFNVTSNIEDAQWFLGQLNEIDVLSANASDFLDENA